MLAHNPFSALRQPVEVLQAAKKSTVNPTPIKNPFTYLREVESIDTYTAYIRHVYKENAHIVQWALHHSDIANVREPLLSLQDCIKKAKRIAEESRDLTELDRYTYEMDLVFEVLTQIYDIEKG